MKFTRLSVLRYVGRAGYECRCDCGTTKVIAAHNIVSGASKSCGCLKIERTKQRNSTHGHSRGYRPTSELSTHRSMINRCYNPNWINFYDYGGKGVSVCDRWRFGDGDKTGAHLFIEDMGPKPTKAHTLDRIDGALGYSPDNCRWATRTDQSRNRKSNHWVVYKGVKMLLCDALQLSPIQETAYYTRLKHGWTETEALETPKFNRPQRLLNAK